MTKFEINELKDAFSKVGIGDGDHLLIHSSLRAFGVPSQGSIRDLPETILNYLLEIIGPKGSIAVPTFNFDFCKGIPYNRQETPSKGMGAFSEYIREHKDSIRSKHPIQSIAVLGYEKENLVANDTHTAFEKDSFFDLYLHKNAKVLLVGATFDTVSFIHNADEIVKPPYRFMKDFTSLYIDGDIEEEKTYGMLARDLELDPHIDKFHIEHVLNSQRKLKQANVGVGKIMCFYGTDFVDVAVNCMKSNPYFFVKNGKSFQSYS